MSYSSILIKSYNHPYLKTQEAESAPANLFSASADTLSLLSMNAERKLKYFP